MVLACKTIGSGRQRQLPFELAMWQFNLVYKRRPSHAWPSPRSPDRERPGSNDNLDVFLSDARERHDHQHPGLGLQNVHRWFPADDRRWKCAAGNRICPRHCCHHLHPHRIGNRSRHRFPFDIAQAGRISGGFVSVKAVESEKSIDIVATNEKGGGALQRRQVRWGETSRLYADFRL